MSQPPGPQGPYPQWPGGQPPSGGFPQQGGYPQPGGWQAQPQQGGWAQQPPAGQWGPQGPQGPPPGQFPGYDPFGDEDDDDGKKSPLPWILGGLGAVVVIGGVILLIILLGGSGAEKGGTARETADAFATRFNERDVAAIKGLLCEADLNGKTGKDLDSGNAFKNVPETGRIEVAKLEETAPGRATAHYDQLVGDQKKSDETIEIPLVKNGDVWEICVEQDGPTGSGPAQGTPDGAATAPPPSN